MGVGAGDSSKILKTPEVYYAGLCGEKKSIGFCANLCEASGPCFLNNSPTVLKNIMRDAGETITRGLHWSGGGQAVKKRKNKRKEENAEERGREKGEGEGQGEGEEEEEDDEEEEEEEVEEDEDLFESYITNGTHPPAPPDR